MMPLERVNTVAKNNVRLENLRPEDPPHLGQRRAVKRSFGSLSGRVGESVKTFGNCCRRSP
jgi:hypothetical protein